MEYMDAYVDNSMSPSPNTVNDLSMNLDYDDIIRRAERADSYIAALNKIMDAAVKITTKNDWVLIGGKPYLQETGATKVARLFGINFAPIGDPVKELDEGYPAYTYKMRFSMGNTVIEAIGARSGKDEFFAGKNRSKTPDQVDAYDVMKAAYTNCLNNGIKRILPGLRNIDAAALERCGFDPSRMNGYTFKTGSKGGNSGKAEDSGIVCDGCGAPITQKVASYSESKFGMKLCMKCQKNPPKSDADDGDAYDDGYLPPEPPAGY